MAKSQKPDSEVANSTKRLASRFHQLKTGGARIGQYLHWAKVRPDAQCWWCKCPSQTRDHLFKVCPEWKVLQKVLWAEVQKETGRWKSRWKIRDLLADKRCGKAVLDFLTATDVGRLVPPVEEDGPLSQTSEWELRERKEREEEQEAEARSWVLRKARAPERNYRCSYPRPPSWHGQARSRGTGCAFLYFFPSVSFLGAFISFLGTGLGGGQREACNEPPLRGLRRGKPGKMYTAMIYRGRMRV